MNGSQIMRMRFNVLPIITMTQIIFYSAFREVYGASSPSKSPLLSLDGNTLIINNNEILQRLAEHFSNILNRQSAINEKQSTDSLRYMPMMSTVKIILDDPPTLQETETAIARLSTGKAACLDAFPAEIYKEGVTLTNKLHELFDVIWENATFP